MIWKAEIDNSLNRSRILSGSYSYWKDFGPNELRHLVSEDSFWSLVQEENNWFLKYIGNPLKFDESPVVCLRYTPLGWWRANININDGWESGFTLRKPKVFIGENEGEFFIKDHRNELLKAKDLCKPLLSF